mmetsp:Transcript_19925/g.28815  ORF Transcript_19925/g.28815 Transcript_19925/m.28815 type:complete len:98 (+) Transcript_19925:456-749(+)
MGHPPTHPNEFVRWYPGGPRHEIRRERPKGFRSHFWDSVERFDTGARVGCITGTVDRWTPRCDESLDTRYQSCDDGNEEEGNDDDRSEDNETRIEEY